MDSCLRRDGAFARSRQFEFTPPNSAMGRPRLAFGAEIAAIAERIVYRINFASEDLGARKYRCEASATGADADDPSVAGELYPFRMASRRTLTYWKKKVAS